jgi:hypothetical protein
MGQYYRTVFLSDNGEIIGWSECNWGVKMMEHSYIGNTFIIAIEEYLHRNPCRVVWAGDYSEPEPIKTNIESAIKALRFLANKSKTGVKDDVSKEINEIYEEYDKYIDKAHNILNKSFTESFIEDDYHCINFALDKMADNLYGMCDEIKPIRLICKEGKTESGYPYIINHTKKQYVDIRKNKSTDIQEYDENHLRIHPLPLLTRESEVGSGGDYRGVGDEDLGIWARDKISMESKVPDGLFTKIIVGFVE